MRLRCWPTVPAAAHPSSSVGTLLSARVSRLCSDLGSSDGVTSSVGSVEEEEPRTSMNTNFSHASTNALGVWRCPTPITRLPDSRRRIARGVKSLSLDTIAKPSTWPE
jgi:hypothetical protein